MAAAAEEGSFSFLRKKKSDIKKEIYSILYENMLCLAVFPDTNERITICTNVQYKKNVCKSCYANIYKK